MNKIHIIKTDRGGSKFNKYENYMRLWIGKKSDIKEFLQNCSYNIICRNI